MRRISSFLLPAILVSGGGVFALAQKAEQCPPKPPGPVREVNFVESDSENIYNYELHGNARIVEPAPLGIPRALRIDQMFSFALLKDIDISPSNMKDCTISIGVYIESIKPNSDGWVLSHDNGAFDRAIFLHDDRFNGMGLSLGYKYAAHQKPTIPALKKWIQIFAVFRQRGACDMYVDGEKVSFQKQVVGLNGKGLPNIAIGAPEKKAYGAINDADLWVNEVKVYNYAMDYDQIKSLGCENQCVSHILCIYDKIYYLHQQLITNF